MYASEEKAKAEAWNRLEVLRDPSHVRALSLGELTGLFRGAGLPEPTVELYELRGDVQGLLARSFPLPGDAERITGCSQPKQRRIHGNDVRREEEALYYAYRVAILAATLG